MSYPYLLCSQFRRDQRLFDFNLRAAASSLSYTYLAPQCKAKERKKEKRIKQGIISIKGKERVTQAKQEL